MTLSWWVFEHLLFSIPRFSCPPITDIKWRYYPSSTTEVFAPVDWGCVWGVRWSVSYISVVKSCVWKGLINTVIRERRLYLLVAACWRHWIYQSSDEKLPFSSTKTSWKGTKTNYLKETSDLNPPENLWGELTPATAERNPASFVFFYSVILAILWKIFCLYKLVHVSQVFSDSRSSVKFRNTNK